MRPDTVPGKSPFMKHLARLLLVTLFFVSPVLGQTASLSFSGGNGAPLTVTLNSPVVFTINPGTPDSSAFFTFENVGNIMDMMFGTGSGTLSFSINGGGNVFITNGNSGYSSPSVTPDDFYVYDNSVFPLVQGNDSITLNAGSWTTTANIAAVAPANGNYEAFITNGSGQRISTVPEPSSIVLLGLGLLTLAGLRGKRNRR